MFVSRLRRRKGRVKEAEGNLDTGAGMSAKRQPGFYFTDKAKPRAQCPHNAIPKKLSVALPLEVALPITSFRNFSPTCLFLYLYQHTL